MTISPNTSDASFDTNGTPGLLVHNPVTGATEKATASIFNGSGGYRPNNVDVASATITYVGSTNSGGSWTIQKIDTTSGIVLTYASGVSAYSTNWTNRASLTYTL